MYIKILTKECQLCVYKSIANGFSDEHIRSHILLTFYVLINTEIVFNIDLKKAVIDDIEDQYEHIFRANDYEITAAVVYIVGDKLLNIIC